MTDNNILSYRVYKEMLRIIDEGWKYNGVPLSGDVEAWFYINEWDTRDNKNDDNR